MSHSHPRRHRWLAAASAALLTFILTPASAKAAPQADDFSEKVNNLTQTQPSDPIVRQVQDPAPRPAASDLTPTDTNGGWTELLVTFDNPQVSAAVRGNTEAAVAELQAHEAATFDAVESHLDAIAADGELEVLQRFWITNAILVKALRDQDVIDRIAAIPGVVSVDPNFTVRQLDVPMAPGMGPDDPDLVRTGPNGEKITYGLDKIGAAKVWHDFGVHGEGIRVAVLDSGVDAAHPDLKDRLVGHNLNDPSYPGGWIAFDRHGNPIVTSPEDPGSHGTHVSGTVMGGNASGTYIGVAPKAELMVARALAGEGAGSFSTILASLQWALAPHTGNSVDERVGRPANVINMSLGVNGYYDDLASIMRNIRDAGIFPAIAIGNTPCGDTGTSSPGNLYESVGVGMTTPEDTVHPDSCGAVVTWPEETRAKYGWPKSFVKPDLSAPGSRVLSAMPGGRWGLSTGTSMATPHVAGAAALIMSAQAGLSVDEIEAALQQTSYHPGGTRPDPRYGYGRIDVYAALQHVLGAAGISGRVIDADTGEPIADAVVSYKEISERWQTNEQGNFQAKIVPGTYTLTVAKFGYENATVQVVVSDSQITSVEVKLKPINAGVIRGTVVDQVTGEPIAGAEVAIVGIDRRTTTKDDGTYELADLPVGKYQVRVSAPTYADSISALAPVAAGAVTTINYRMAQLTKVLVVGDSGRTVEFLQKHQLIVTGVDAMPTVAQLKEGGYNVIIVDHPPTIAVDHAQELVNYFSAAGTGVLWLDLGNSEDAGIAQISRLTGEPTDRSGGSDKTLKRIGYHILQDHQIFTRGFADGKGFTPDTLLVQNDREAGTKYYASFGDMPHGTVLATTMITHQDDTNETVGNGIAVSEWGNHRSVYFALHGTAASFDTRNWSAASTQVFLNAIDWAAPQSVSSVPPEISGPVVPTPPEDDKPGPQPEPSPQPQPEPSPDPQEPDPKPSPDPDPEPNPDPQEPDPKPSPDPDPEPSPDPQEPDPKPSPDPDPEPSPDPQKPDPKPDPSPAPPPLIPTDPNKPPWQPPGLGGPGAGVRPPVLQVRPPVLQVRPPVMQPPVMRPPVALPAKPKTTPPAAFGTEDALRAAPTNGVQVEVKNKLAIVTIPNAKPGDWFYLHMYPKALGVDWLRVGPEGVITLDIGKLGPKQYALAFTNKDGGFTGWADLDLREEEEEAAEETAPPQPKRTPKPVQSAPVATQPSAVAVAEKRGLSNAEMALLGGSGLLFLAAAFVLIGTARRRQA